MEINRPLPRAGAGLPAREQSSKRYIQLIILALVVMAGLSGCVTLTDYNASQDYTADVIGTLDAQTSLGQAFVSLRPNLDGITVWITRVPSIGPAASTNVDQLSVSLYLAPGDLVPVYTTTVVLPTTGDNLAITIPTPGQKNPAGQGYYLVLGNSSGTVQVKGRAEDAYPLGQAYANGQPLQADFAFRLSYAYGFASFISDITTSLPSAWLIFPLLAVLWLPGFLLLELSGLRRRYDFGEQVALSVGFSLALIPVLMLWTSVLKIRWSGAGIYIAAGFLLAILLIRLLYNAIVARRRSAKADLDEINSPPTAHPVKNKASLFVSVALVLAFLAALAVRLVMVRDLATPAWVDSVHHALITRLVLENGAYPSTYQPYLDIAPSVYHPGFHSLAAAFTWLSQLDLERSMLVLGQVLNALCVFSVYLFARTLTRSQLAGLLAAIVTGFLTPMPAYYTSWGRYTELAGLLLLPLIPALLQPLLDGPSTRKPAWLIILGGIAGGGLFMVHYRVLAFLACLVVAIVLFNLIRRKEDQGYSSLRLLSVVALMAGLGILLVLPWFIQAFKTNLLPYVTSTVSSPVPFFQDFAWPFLTSALGKQAMAVAGLGLVWGVIQRKRFTFILVLWVVLLFLLANLAALKLPGGGLVSNSSVEIMLFIPISILAGYFIDQLLAHWKALVPPPLAVPSIVLAVLLVGYVSYLGATQLVPILNPVTILSRQADLPAMGWIERNIPAGETVVINPFNWGYGLYAGNDGGYWISPLTGRPTLPPPVLYGLGPEASQISELSLQILQLAPEPIKLWEFLHTHALHYVYIGARGGVLSPEKLASSGLFTALYQQDGVWIFVVKP